MEFQCSILNDYEGAISLETNSVYGVSLTTVSRVLLTHGFSSKSGGALTGISGGEQNFDIVARKGPKTIAAEVLPAGDRKKCEIRLINMRAKIWDSAPDLAIAIAPAEVGPELEALAKNYKFVLIEALSEEDLEAKLEELMQLLD